MNSSKATEICGNVAGWYSQADMYQAIGFAIVIIGVLCGSAVSIYTDSLDKKYIKLLSFISVFCITLITYFNPIDRGNNFREAWRTLNVACMSHVKIENENDVTDLIEAYKKGEEKIGPITISTTKNTK